jgi:5'-nucleotidase
MKNKNGKKLNILVTNDDGVTAAGLLALVQGMRALGNVFILAPDHNWSASGHVKTLDRPLRVKEVCLEDGTTAFASDGAPSDCVALAIAGFFKHKIDLVVSGINPYANVGHDVTYSGTVTAAMESVIWGIPAVAISLDQPDNYHGSIDYSTAAAAGRQVANNVCKNGIAADVLLNVNVPFLSHSQIKGYQMTRQGLRVYHDRLDRRTDPRHRPYYWVIGDLPTGIPEPGTDIGALMEGYVSVTPIQLDLTAHHLIDKIKQWEWMVEGVGKEILIKEEYHEEIPLFTGAYF